jgi:serine/threonine protein kinase/tetratricopeptide (TPR) repeat protein
MPDTRPSKTRLEWPIFRASMAQRDGKPPGSLSRTARAGRAPMPTLYGGRYLVRREVGSGGMGRVFLAHDLRLSRDVAVKVLLPGPHHEKQMRRLEQEARTAGSLNHPNIVAVHDVGEHKGEPFIVTELLRGETLGEALRGGPFAPERARQLALQLAEGLLAAHEQGIVHRDLKPANLFITEDGRLKILDFGIAQLPSPGAGALTRKSASGGVAGTVSYMSPEQIRGRKLDARSDLFSFGAVLHEMLTGTPPFERATTFETAHAILVDRAAPLPALTSVTLARVVARCLRKNPAERFSSAREAAVALSALRTRSPPRPRRRLVDAVTGIDEATVSLLAKVRSPARGGAPSIAVLPFADMSPKKNQEHFSDGLGEELINALAQIEGLHVAGRTSSFWFKGKSEDLRSIGKKLGVAHVLEGSVRKAAGRVRITAKLVGVRDGFQLWTQTYDRELNDIFAVQDNIARAVVDALRVKLVPGKRPAAEMRRTSSPEAYAWYLLGRQLSDRLSAESIQRAVCAFESALSIDPGYAPALAGLAIALYRSADLGPATTAPEEYRRALESAEKAVALDANLAEAYASRGRLRADLKWDWAGARADLSLALALRPTDANVQWQYGNLLAAVGRLRDALAIGHRCVELDPLSANAWNFLAALHVSAGEPAQARREFEHALQISPEHAFALLNLGKLQLVQGRPAEALSTYGRSTEPAARLTGSALAHHDLGNVKEARQALGELIARHRENAAYYIAWVFAWRGESDRAFEWLETAFRQHDTGLVFIKQDPLLRKIRTDPRYLTLVRRMNLPPD